MEDVTESFSSMTYDLPSGGIVVSDSWTMDELIVLEFGDMEIPARIAPKATTPRRMEMIIIFFIFYFVHI